MNPASLDLLLRFLESPVLRFPRSQITGYHGPTGEALIAAGMLVPDGFVRGSEAEDDAEGEVFAVTMEDRQDGLGFFHPYKGRIAVDQAALQRFKPDFTTIFKQLLGAELTLPPRGIGELEAGLIWQIGTMRLGRLVLTEVWFARRLGTAEGMQALSTMMSRRPPAAPRLVLTATPPKHLPSEVLPLARIVPISDVLAGDGRTSIDNDMLRARFAGQPAGAITSPLHLSKDGRTLTVNGMTTIAFSGEVQIATIRILFEAHRSGTRVRAAEVLAQAQSQARTFSQAFGKQWPALQPFLVSQDGLWRFDL